MALFFIKLTSNLLRASMRSDEFLIAILDQNSEWERVPFLSASSSSNKASHRPSVIHFVRFMCLMNSARLILWSLLASAFWNITLIYSISSHWPKKSNLHQTCLGHLKARQRIRFFHTSRIPNEKVFHLYWHREHRRIHPSFFRRYIFPLRLGWTFFYFIFCLIRCCWIVRIYSLTEDPVWAAVT